MAELKIEDGRVYKVEDVTEQIQRDIDGVCARMAQKLEQRQKYMQTIADYEAAVKQLDAEVEAEINAAGIDREISKAIAPEKAARLGF